MSYSQIYSQYLALSKTYNYRCPITRGTVAQILEQYCGLLALMEHPYLNIEPLIIKCIRDLRDKIDPADVVVLPSNIMNKL